MGYNQNNQLVQLTLCLNMYANTALINRLNKQLYSYKYFVQK